MLAALPELKVNDLQSRSTHVVIIYNFLREGGVRGCKYSTRRLPAQRPLLVTTYEGPEVETFLRSVVYRAKYIYRVRKPLVRRLYFLK